MSWKNYKGIAGYNQMVSEIRESIYAEFPEAKAKLYIYNFMEPGELERAEKYLNVSNLSQQVNTQLLQPQLGNFPLMPGGQLAILKNNRGGDVFLSIPWNPRFKSIAAPNASNAMVASQLTPEEISIAAWNTLHEASHGIQKALGSDVAAQKHLAYDNISWRRFIEGSAEVFARGTLALHGQDRSTIADSIMASYDSRKIFSDSYDPSQAMTSFLAANRPKSDELKSYRFTELRQTLKKAEELTLCHMGDKTAQEHSNIEARALDAVVNDLNQRGLTQTQIQEWIMARKDTLLRATQMEAGQKFQQNPIGDYQSFDRPSFSIGTAVINQWKRSMNSDDPADQKLAEGLRAGAIDQTISNIKDKVFGGHQVETAACPATFTSGKPLPSNGTSHKK